MNVAQLSAMIEKHRLDPNYQHREMDDTTFNQNAGLSIERLNTERRTKLNKVWAKFGVSPALGARARYLAQTNLFFLCKLLGYKEMSDQTYTWTDGQVHNTHEEICNEFFVRKDPTVKTLKEFAMAYIQEKERLLLVPRGGFKSTMNMSDSIQYIICYPEVTILVLSGVLSLANKFIGEIKEHFTLEEGTAEFQDMFVPKKTFRPKMVDDGTFNMFQILFAEHCIPVDDGKANEFDTPASTFKGKEPTIFSASIEQSLTGFHVAVLKLDDVVTNENSLTVERLKAVNKQVSINQAMLHPYGFYDKIGTWYDAEDIYGQDIKNRDIYLAEGEKFPMKIYIRAAWWANLEAVKMGKIEDEMQKTDWELWFSVADNPNSLTYERLRYLKKTDPYFAIKYLNDPTQMHVVKFPRELLIRKTVTAHEVPDTGMIVTTVDTAYSTKSWADYTVILTALISGGRFYIIDMKRGRFDEYALPAIIAATAHQWKPQRICIEESGAIKYIAREVHREMDKLKIRVPVELVPLGQGIKNKNRKNVQAGPVLRLLGDDRIKFVNTCPSLDELYDELSKFGTASSTHDDIVDAMSILVNQFSGYAEAEAKIQAAQLDFSPNPGARSMYDMVHGLGKYDKYNARNTMLEFPDQAPDQAPDQVAKRAAEETAWANNNPLGDLF